MGWEEDFIWIGTRAQWKIASVLATIAANAWQQLCQGYSNAGLVGGMVAVSVSSADYKMRNMRSS